MDKDITPVFRVWKEELSQHIEKYAPYHPSQQLKQMAAFFSPGLSYYFIINFHNLEMEHVSEGTRDILGIAPEEFNMERLLQKLPPEELSVLGKKESLITDFFNNYLTPEDIPFYKVVYLFHARDGSGKMRTMLHQATTLTVSSMGKIEHVLSVQTDISHLSLVKTNWVSLISLKGDRSYFNLYPEKGIFDPKTCPPEKAEISAGLTKRELEILKLLSHGFTANQIAGKLNISENTVRTHRKNMLLKTECSNITELVARCLVEGVI